jgi:hypothetical protein
MSKAIFDLISLYEIITMLLLTIIKKEVLHTGHENMILKNYFEKLLWQCTFVILCLTEESGLIMSSLYIEINALKPGCRCGW